MSTVPNGVCEISLPSFLTTKEKEFIEFTARLLLDARQRKATGKLMVEADIQDGGITAKWSNTRYKER